MARTKQTIAMIGIWLGLLLTSACNASTPTGTPTVDLNPLRTEVASTVLAEVTRDLAMTPSATPIPSSTVTPVPSSTASLAPSSTPAQPDTTATGPEATSASESGRQPPTWRNGFPNP